MTDTAVELSQRKDYPVLGIATFIGNLVLMALISATSLRYFTTKLAPAFLRLSGKTLAEGGLAMTTSIFLFVKAPSF